MTKANLLPVIHRVLSSFCPLPRSLDRHQLGASYRFLWRDKEKFSTLKRGRRELDGCSNPRKNKEALLFFSPCSYACRLNFLFKADCILSHTTYITPSLCSLVVFARKPSKKVIVPRFPPFFPPSF